MPILRLVAAIGFLLFVGGALLSGCDGTGSKRASKYERLNRTSWEVVLEESSGISMSLFRQRYKRVRLFFEEDDGSRTYRITGHFSEDSTAVLTRGMIALPDEDVLQMIPESKRRNLVTWTYKFQTKTRAIFSVRTGSRSFLRMLFPYTTWSSQAVTMALAPVDE